MSSKLVFTPICLALALSLGASSQVQASRPDEAAPTEEPRAPVQIAIIVDASQLDDDLRNVPETVTTDKLKDALTNAGYTVSDGVVDIAIRVVFEQVDAGKRLDHGVHFEFIKGPTVTTPIRWVICNICAQVRLEEKLDEVMPQLLAELGKVIEPDGSIDGSNGGTTTEPAPPTTPPPPTKPIGALGGVGIGVAALGLGGIAWGAVDLARGRAYDQSDANRLTRQPWTDYGPRGAVLLGVGIGGVVLGGALLVTDIMIRAKKRKSASPAAGAFAPVLSPQVVGLGWARRF
jgi:hypothetical protein